MAVIYTNKIKIPKYFKLPRKEKKAFKNYLNGVKVSGILVNPLKKHSTKELTEDYLTMLYHAYKCHKYNGIKEYAPIDFEELESGREEVNPTTEVVREAMRIVSKDVKKPRCVRDGRVKDNNNE